MGLSQLLTGWLIKDQVTDFAERIAGRSRQQVWQRVQHRVVTLGTHEARGYLRARAASVIHEETDRLISQEGARASRHRERLMSIAGDMLIQSILTSTHLARQARPGHRTAA